MIFDKDYLFNKNVNYKVSDKLVKNKYGITKGIFVDSLLYQNKKTTFFAYLGIPNKEMPKSGYPAIILCHGGGGSAFFEWVEYWNKKGYIALAPDFSGREFGSIKYDGKAGDNVIKINKDARPADYGSFSSSSTDYLNSWSYHSVCNIIFSHNILLNLDIVDKEKTALTGISWGGVLTTIVSGVDDRFKAFAPIYGSGFYYSLPHFKDNLKMVQNDDLVDWINCYDPSRYLNKCYRPIMFTLGMKDDCFTCTTNSNSSKLTNSKVYYSYRGILDHYHRFKDNEGMLSVYHFINSTLYNKSLPYEISSKLISPKCYLIKIKNYKKIKKATLWYTSSTTEIEKNWIWNQKEIEIKNEISLELTNDIKACFIEFSDNKKYEIIYSTEIFFN